MISTSMKTSHFSFLHPPIYHINIATFDLNKNLIQIENLANTSKVTAKALNLE